VALPDGYDAKRASGVLLGVWLARRKTRASRGSFRLAD